MSEVSLPGKRAESGGLKEELVNCISRPSPATQRHGHTEDGLCPKLSCALGSSLAERRVTFLLTQDEGLAFPV